MARPASNPSILIADDDEDARRDLRARLEQRLAWKVCGEAATAAETIDMARRLRPDIIFLDLNLPDMDAAQAITEINEVCPALKIVVSGSRDSGEWAVRALAAGANGMVMKSDAARDLVLTVQNIRENGGFLSPVAERRLMKYIRQEMKKMIRQRAAIQRAIADFERLEVRSLAKGNPNGSIGLASFKNVIEMKKRPGSGKRVASQTG